MSKETWKKQSGVFRLIGMDFMMDQEFNLWFIESNYGPQLPKLLEERWHFMEVLIRDLFEIEYALLRSRMLRIRMFLKKVLGENSIQNLTGNIDSLKKQFSEVNIDRFETEFPLRDTNTFQKIIDLNFGENIEGYMYVLDDSCFN